MPVMFIPPDPERATLIRATVSALGGLKKVATELGYKTTERVRHFYAPGFPVPAEKCRKFVAISRGLLTLSLLRPDLYAGLSETELGYRPKRAKAAAEEPAT